jgi:uncharacterized protein DUF1638
MSSSPTDPTSTTSSSTSSPSPASRVAVIACGAIAQPIIQIIQRTGLPLDVQPLPPLLHNHPERIAGEVEGLTTALLSQGVRVVLGYADCGTYGALDALCARLDLQRLKGLHCYDVYGGADRVKALFDQEPGTYLLTDFLVRAFARTVLVELGLDRHPELRDAYFANYTRVVWLAQDPDDELESLAHQASEALGLPLVVVPTGTTGLEQQLRELVEAAVRPAAVAASSPSGRSG